jgi:hypothetical protein
MTLHAAIARSVIELLTSTPAFDVKFVYTKYGAEIEPDRSLIVWSANLEDQLSEHIRRIIEEHNRKDSGHE